MKNKNICEYFQMFYGSWNFLPSVYGSPGGALSIYTGGGVPQHIQKGGS